MPDTGWLSPTNTGTHSGSGGTGAWYGTERVKGDADDIAAFIGPVGASLANNQVTHWLWGSGFNASVPADGVVTGVAVRFRIRKTAGSVVVRDVLLRQDAPYGIFMEATNKLPDRNLGGLETLEYGGQMDRWGWADLSRANVNKAGFGFAIACKATAAGSKPEVDTMQIKVFYNTSLAITVDPTTSESGPVMGAALLGSVSITPADIPSSTSSADLVAALLGSISITPNDVPSSESDPVDGVVVESSYFLAIPVEDAVSESDAVDGVALLASLAITPNEVPASTSDALGPALVVIGSITVVPDDIPTSESGPVLGRASIAIRITDLPPTTSESGPIDADVQVVWDVLSVYPDFLRNSQQSTVRAFPLLVTITHPDLPETLRYTDAGIPLSSRGQVYEALPMVVTLPTNGRNQASEGSIVVPIQSRQIRGTFRTLKSKAARVLIEMVRGDDPDIVERSWPMRLAASETSQAVTLGLNDGDFEDRQFPPLVFNAQWAAVHD